ncbi:hypothetical protein Purlil1_12862 [Purpureocillium lilacinum]|uniref:Uncharacterized protein n=1 Tax=Purpureocillium lilacinum TaxID=33203 RepID=A0ABR0BFV7_PURLI|nr:hypothetical protein Purlil1_12862 [Purpureocillium lilacinum]
MLTPSFATANQTAAHSGGHTRTFCLPSGRQNAHFPQDRQRNIIESHAGPAPFVHRLCLTSTSPRPLVRLLAGISSDGDMSKLVSTICGLADACVELLITDGQTLSASTADVARIRAAWPNAAAVVFVARRSWPHRLVSHSGPSACSLRGLWADCLSPLSERSESRRLTPATSQPSTASASPTSTGSQLQAGLWGTQAQREPNAEVPAWLSNVVIEWQDLVLNRNGGEAWWKAAETLRSASLSFMQLRTWAPLAGKEQSANPPALTEERQAEGAFGGTNAATHAEGQSGVLGPCDQLRLRPSTNGTGGRQ